MESSQIVVEVTPEGEVRLDAQGFQGPRCRQTTDALVRRLAQMGLSLGVEETADKPEMAETETTRQRVTH